MRSAHLARLVGEQMQQRFHLSRGPTKNRLQGREAEFLGDYGFRMPSERQVLFLLPWHPGVVVHQAERNARQEPDIVSDTDAAGCRQIPVAEPCCVAREDTCSIELEYNWNRTRGPADILASGAVAFRVELHRR